MKKTLLITIIMLIVTTLAAQNRVSYISESFDGATMPDGWTVKGIGLTNWSVSTTCNAGGSPNEMKLSSYPSFLGISRLVMPAVDLTGVSSVVFMFKHNLDNYNGSHILGIATSSNGGSTWHEAWSETYNSNGQYTVYQDITTEDFGNPNVMFCIFYSGNSYNINNWYFDDISVFSMEELEIGITRIDVPNNTAAGDVPVSFTVFNHGNTAITSVEANYQFENHDVITETFTTDIAYSTYSTINFSVPTNLILGTYNLTINITAVNGTQDIDPENNTMSKSITALLGTAQKIPMIEHFSSSTCGPCVAVDQAMLALTESNLGKFTYTKYPMNWPSGGDLYYTAEGGVRKNYYGVDGVPQTFLDGQDQGYAAVSQNALNQHYSEPAFAEIRGSFNVEGNIITVIADAMAYVDIEDVKMYISVNEKLTTGNVGGNGETEFHHVMMKMLDDAEGSDMNINAGKYSRVEFTFDMSSTHVEEMDDLEVSAWLQNYESKEIFNSHFLYENTPHPYPADNLTLNDNYDNTVTASWDAAQGGNATGYNVYLNKILVAENTSDLSYTFDSQEGNYYIVEVIAMYDEGMTSVKAVAGIFKALNVNEMQENSYSMYPNPANSFVKIIAKDKIQSISIFNCVGALIDRINVSANEVELNTAKYNTGIYFVNVTSENGQSCTKKLIVNSL